MKRSILFGTAVVALALNLAIGATVYLKSARASDRKDSLDANMDLFAAVMQKIRAEYVDGTNLTYRGLTSSALKGMVNSLDPHSEFLDAQHYQQLQNDTEGQFGGLGLVVAMRDGYVTVVAPMEDTPGFRARIMTGDRIVMVNGKRVEGLQLGTVVDQLRGDPGTTVTMTIQRPATGEEKTITLTRAIIQMDMVKDINGKKEFPLGTDGIGYIRITEFGDRTSDELEVALNKLKAQGMKGLILDLRLNPGGLLDEAVKVCQKFLPRGQLIVSTEGSDPSQNSVLRARGRGDELPGMPIVVLVNLGSASASEIVTGCLQDLKRAVILGEKTFGKGSVQTIFPIGDGALKLTVAKYYTPSHRVIHEHGIEPDLYVPMSEEQEGALQLTRVPGGLEVLDATKRVQVAQIRDVQLEAAENLLKDMLQYNQLQSAPPKTAEK